jgi:hypothetical protein
MVRMLETAWTLGSAILLCSTAGAQEAAPGAGHDAVLAEARELLKKGEHEAAIGLLRPAIDEMITEGVAIREDLREAYLLLVNTNVQRMNHFNQNVEERQTARLWRDKAKDVIRECLTTPGLDDTEPDLAQDPPEMVALFEEVRGEIFGTFRVVKLDPPKARVHLDGEFLGTGADGLPLERKNLQAGPHVVVVRADGYKDQTEDIDVAPGHTLDSKYTLKKKAGPTTWGLRAGLVAAAAVGVAALVDGGSGGSAPTPLPEPPPPPAN